MTAWWRAVRVRWRTSPGGTDPPVADLRTRAALTVAMALGIPAFQAHISRSIGTDILSPEGDRRVIPAVLDIQSHPTISLDAARTLREGLDKPHA